MSSPSIQAIVAQIRTAIYGRDVRENIALGIEKCYDDVSTSVAKIDNMTVASQVATGSTPSVTISEVSGHKHILFKMVNGKDCYIFIRYSQNQPTRDADMSTTPNNWMGIYYGFNSTAPTAYTSYTWFKIKGDPGLPVVTTADNGKYLRVINGEWAATTLPNASGVSF